MGFFGDFPWLQNLDDFDCFDVGDVDMKEVIFRPFKGRWRFDFVARLLFSLCVLGFVGV